MLTRRQFIVGGAAATVGVMAAGGGGLALWDAATRPVSASDDWRTAKGVDRILLAATLAPSSHNTQPWRFRLREDGIDILGDRERTMGAADPLLRELHVSLGCAVENAAIVAALEDTPLGVEIVRGRGGLHFAKMTHADTGSAEGTPAGLASAIPLRRTNRGPYDAGKPIPHSMLADLSALASGGVGVSWITSAAERSRVGEISARAASALIGDREMQRDSHRWYRMSRSDALRHCDGVTVSGANLPPVVSLLLGVFPPSPDSFDASWAETTLKTHCGTAPAFGVLTVGTAEDRAAWVETGRTFERIQLAATRAGMAVQPISQALAMRDREQASGAPGYFSVAMRELGGDAEVALVFRIGFPLREQPPSPRRHAVVL